MLAQEAPTEVPNFPFSEKLNSRNLPLELDLALTQPKALPAAAEVIPLNVQRAIFADTSP